MPASARVTACNVSREQVRWARARTRKEGLEDRVTFVWSAPNRIPLPEPAVRRVVESVRPFPFDRMYGGWWAPVVRHGARQILEDSAARYIQFLRGEVPVD